MTSEESDHESFWEHVKCVCVVVSQIRLKGIGIPFIPSFSHLFSANDWGCRYTT